MVKPRPRPGSLLLRADVHVGDQVVVTHTIDVSEVEVTIACDLPVGAEVTLKVSFPGLVDAFEVHVRVTSVWSQDGYGRPAGARCVIVSADEHALRTLRSLVAHRSGQGVSGASAAPQGVYRCLLVEDNSFIRDLFAYGVNRYTHDRGTPLTLAMATDAEGAWEMLSRDHYDMAIVDHFLPMQTGSQLIERVRAEPALSGMSVVAISVGGVDARAEAMAAGADLFLDKPIVLRDLFSTLDTLAATRDAR